MKYLWPALFLVACSGGGKDSDGPGTVDTGAPLVELPAISINEFMASNATGIQDEALRFPDWIELFNPGDEPADLGGWWMSSDTADPFDWLVPAGVTVPAGGYLVIFADNDPEEGDNHASFALDAAGGEDILLSGPDSHGNPVIDEVDQFGPQQTDVSLARQPDGATAWSFDDTPTPGAAND